MKSARDKSDNEILRQKAEDSLKKNPANLGYYCLPTPYNADTIKLLHQLEVQRIELEMQNAELVLAKENATKLAADKYAVLYDFAPTGYFTLSAEGKIMELNLSGSQMLGKERTHLINSRFGFFVSDDTKPIFNSFIGKIFSGKVKTECEVILSTGANIPIHVYLAGVAAENGEHCLVNMVDITKRKLAEQELIIANKELVFQNEEKVKRAAELIAAKKEIAFQGELIIASGLITMLLDSIPDLIFYKDTDGVYIGCNPSFAEFIGKSRDEIIGKTDYDLFSKEGADIFRHHDNEMLKQKLPRHNEEWIAMPDGKKVLVDTVKTPYWAGDGRLIGILGISRDITERKDLEENLRKINAEKDKFFSIMAHDLRSPFHAFLGLTNILSTDIQTMKPGLVEQMARMLNESATNLFNLLENLLEWSRSQMGVTAFKPDTFFLLPEITKIIKPVLDMANNKGVEMAFNIPENLEVFADAYMLGSTIRNLSANAVKFTRRGGKVTVAAKPASGNSIEISISDSGIGMSSAMVDDLFSLSARTNRKGTDGEPSTGLGLFICKDFIEKHGGKIWIESEEGKGSIFYLTLPYPSDQKEKNVIEKSGSADKRKIEIKNLKILISDDDETSDFLLTRMLNKISREILHAKNGAVAIEICANNADIDLILMDLGMPVMNGYEATQQIRRFNKDVIIIAQTANSLKGNEDRLAIDSGCNDFIAKPIMEDELMDLIQKHFTFSHGETFRNLKP
ncbi:MAG: PAS domain-containing protein [Bacteroidetes bacterium]|nr:PAS domain-containing protein [Bacteroidota bacterium]